jgi:hypothetical protein
MKTSSKIALVIIAAVAWIHAGLAVDVIMDSRCNIYGAGHSFPNNAPTVGTHGGGVPPVMISLNDLGNPPALEFQATGTVSYCPACGSAGSDGASFISAGPGYNGISGITNFPGRSLVAVFTSEIEPADPAPAALDFAVIGTNYVTLAPQLRQMFFVGDGLRNPTGAQQMVRVPAGATRLYVGLVDGYSYADTPDGYEDNTGSFTVTVNAALFLGIEYSAHKPGISVYGPINSTNRIEYTTTLPSTNWTSLTNIALPSLPVFLYDESSSGDSARFYRAVRLP